MKETNKVGLPPSSAQLKLMQDLRIFFDVETMTKNVAMKTISEFLKKKNRERLKSLIKRRKNENK